MPLAATEGRLADARAAISAAQDAIDTADAKCCSSPSFRHRAAKATAQAGFDAAQQAIRAAPAAEAAFQAAGADLGTAQDALAKVTAEKTAAAAELTRVAATLTPFNPRQLRELAGQDGCVEGDIEAARNTAAPKVALTDLIVVYNQLRKQAAQEGCSMEEIEAVWRGAGRRNAALNALIVSNGVLRSVRLVQPTGSGNERYKKGAWRRR